MHASNLTKFLSLSTCYEPISGQFVIIGIPNVWILNVCIHALCICVVLYCVITCMCVYAYIYVYMISCIHNECYCMVYFKNISFSVSNKSLPPPPQLTNKSTIKFRCSPFIKCKHVIICLQSFNKLLYWSNTQWK